ncbi:DUF2867 domain-containing protein [Streptomyces sp. V1I1]|uniref:DUF2867 domain-containing protein n=1 Tax=Streptomyces sp. V1I1 TaxID=3042272 RepID=UPI00358E5676
MRLPGTAHTDQPWRIHELTPDFRLEDVWAFRAPGAGPDDFPVMLAAMQAAGGPGTGSWPVRFLFALLWKLGALFGWDEPRAARVAPLRDRLPRDLRETAGGSVAGDSPFTSVYELGNECARELANKTVHAVMHLGWAPAATGGHELRMAVLVKPNGLLGRLYMAAIAPFRHRVVYPALTRQWERAWQNRNGSATVHGAVGTYNVSASVLALSSLPDIDYVDLFILETGLDATPEQWARAMFGDVPSAAEKLIWRGFLGLRLSPGRSPHTVAGWRIAARGDSWIRLETASGFLSCNLVVHTAEGQVSLATYLHYDKSLGRLIWHPLSAIHRRLAPGLLHEAATKVATMTEPNTES